MKLLATVKTRGSTANETAGFQQRPNVTLSVFMRTKQEPVTITAYTLDGLLRRAFILR